MSGDRWRAPIAIEGYTPPEGARLGMDFSQVSDRFSGRFVRNTATEPNFGFTSSTIWLRFTLDTSRVRGQSWYLVERYPILDHISLFAPTEDGGYRRPEFWLSDGWAAVQGEGWQAPLLRC